MKKWMPLLLVVVILAGGLWYWKSGTRTAPPAQNKTAAGLNREVTLINPVGPLVIPVIALDKGKIAGDVKVAVKYWKTNDEVVAMLSKGDVDFAVLPITQAANLYAKQKNLVLVGVHEWKVFYLVAANNAEFNDWRSLKGKTVYTPPSKGQTADVLMRAGIAKEELKPDEDVKISYATPPEIIALFQSGKIDFAALPEPYATQAIAGDKGKIVLDFQKFWGELTAGPEQLPVAGLFVTKQFMDSYPAETAKVEKLFADSTTWGNVNIDQAIDLSKEIFPVPQPVMKDAMQRIDFHYVASKDAQKETDAFLKKMNELYAPALPTVPDAGFYSK
ncbi:MAG TPA: ABC transporter substrate-binding protein [Syntrophomonadaceae bacterium]|nr:ABC transporter substrate-binding protein [Syntrophomonadaceae bacterium]